MRSIVRYLKGHGVDYAFDEATWAYYRRTKLTKVQLFKARARARASRVGFVN